MDTERIEGLETPPLPVIEGALEMVEAEGLHLAWPILAVIPMVYESDLDERRESWFESLQNFVHGRLQMVRGEKTPRNQVM